jgi:hypothetical protein
MGGKTKSDESINKEDTNDLNRAKSLGKEIEIDGGSGRRCWFLGCARAGR